MTTAVAKLERTTLRTSRLLDFCSRKELIAQTGHQIAEWPSDLTPTARWWSR